MKKAFSISVLAAIFFAQCSNPVKEHNATAGSDKDSCCLKNIAPKVAETALQTEITCPECGHKKTETMPTDVCVIKYTCEKCKTEMRPKEGDCCVYCSYGTNKCPSMQ